MSEPPLHVTNGDSTGATLRRTSLGGTVLTWRDVLHEGPVPGLPRRELLHARARFLAGCGWGAQAALAASLEERDGQLLDALHAGVHTVLWFEHDLYDQLQLLDVLSLCHDVAGQPELIVIGSFPGKPGFAGLGELSADELETLWPSRRAATPAELHAAAAAWRAVRAPDPQELAELAAEDAAPLPFLGPALRRLLEELPAPVDGLSGTERRALEVIAGGAETASAAFAAAQRLEAAPFLGDTWFFRALFELGQTPRRLIETADGTPLPAPPALSDGDGTFIRRRLRLTPNGERTLRGDADRVELLGIDRWIGGTHVTSESLWRWDPAARRLQRGP